MAKQNETTQSDPQLGQETGQYNCQRLEASSGVAEFGRLHCGW